MLRFNSVLSYMGYDYCCMTVYPIIIDLVNRQLNCFQIVTNTAIVMLI